jgi:hypothetical protein
MPRWNHISHPELFVVLEVRARHRDELAVPGGDDQVDLGQAALGLRGGHRALAQPERDDVLGADDVLVVEDAHDVPAVDRPRAAHAPGPIVAPAKYPMRTCRPSGR